MLTKPFSASRRSAALRLTAVSLLVLATAACSRDARRAIGVERTPPDEFQVVTRAPLVVPPDFGLRPPQPGAERPNEPTVREKSRAALFGGPALTPSQMVGSTSPGEAALLKATGADSADPAIRDKIDRETSQLASENSSFVDELMFWRSPEPPGLPIDASAEAKRLREAEALGKAPTEGDVPVIKRKSKGILENIF